MASSSWSLFGGASDALPARIEPVKGKDVNLAIFVDGAITRIYNEASVRYKDQRAVKEACKKLLDVLRSDENDHPFTFSVPLGEAETQAILEPIRLACAVDVPRVQEPALGCLHKLVAHTYLQGESSHTGFLTDGSTVSTVTALVSKCGEHTNEAVQLAVVRALLTFVTADHFVLHGESLMQAVRTVFNIAINSDSATIKRTAVNALLQMLNTVLKRVTQGIHYLRSASHSWQSLHSHHSDIPRTNSSTHVPHPTPTLPMHTQPPTPPPLEPEQLRPSTPQVLEVHHATHADANGMAGVGRGEAEEVEMGHDGEVVAVSQGNRAHADEGHGTDAQHEANHEDPQHEAQHQGSQHEGPQPEQSHGVVSFHEGRPPVPQEHSFAYMINGQHDGQREETASPGGACDGQGGADVVGGTDHVVSAEMHVATLASLAEQVDIRGIERALEKDGLASPGERSGPPGGMSRPSSAGGNSVAGGGTESVLGDSVAPSDLGINDPTTTATTSCKEGVRRTLMRDGAARKWKHLNVLERDVLLVLNAICKMAAREAVTSNDNGYLLRGKLTALDLLVRVMDNPLHHWETVRQEFCNQLRQPLCLALLRNCTSSSGEIYALTVRLLGIVLLKPKLRASLKAELGALYPLLVLRPIEAERLDPAQLLPALQVVGVIAADPQLLVDLFVNYDCSLQAANLYERTCRGLARIVKGVEPPAGLVGPVAQQAKHMAVVALQRVLTSLEGWAAPLKEAAMAASAAAEDVVVGGGGGGLAQLRGQSVDRAHDGEHPLNEAERFEAVKEKKHSLEAAVALFNRKPLKGITQAITAGLVGEDAAAIAVFLKQHAGLLNKEMLGEYFGHHEQQQIDVMHAYIDLDRYNGLTIDAALRQLLSHFRLPGESQKIDRIMEKFAERYCKDNPTVFRNAGDAYILAFAIIMLNTDAHNPMAERRLTNADFILMNQTQVDGGDFEPILPETELQAIFDRITSQEIKLPEGSVPTRNTDPNHTPGGTGGGGISNSGTGSAGAPFLKLAASLGITQLLLPFRSGTVWDKQHGVDIERKWLLEKTRALMAQGGATGLLWHHATHSEHARPMLQVSHGYMLKSLRIALRGATDAAAANAALDSMALLVRLCGVLGLQAALEQVIETLEEECGVTKPAPPGSLEESKQIAILATLLSIAGGPEGALLGAGWYRVLRVLSGLQALQQALLPTPAGGPAGVPASFDQPLAPYSTRSLVDKARHSGLHTQGGMNRLMSMLTQRTDSESGLASTLGGPGGVDSPRHTEPADVAVGPGHGLVVWSIQTTGESLTDGVYLRSCGLDGDAVIAFFRALCAVSHKELTPADASETPRVYGVRQLVECMLLNMGRIRLVLNKIWAIVAPHLVSAACAPDERVAKYAVEALRQLIDKLLVRAELANFTYQEEALRPFVAVLRHCDGPTVREFAVKCIAGAITAHPRGLGSGWRSLLQALTIAASDHNAAVVNQALDALQPVVEALYRGWQGHMFLKECVDAIMAAVANRQLEELSTSALYMQQSVARRLTAATASTLPTTGGGGTMGGGGDGVGESPFDGGGGGEEGVVGTTQLLAQGNTMDGTQSSRQGKGVSSHGSAAAAASTQQHAATTPVATQPPARPPVLESWRMLLGTLTKVARLDHRARVADTAVQVMFDILKEYSGVWEGHVFEVVLTECVLPVFDLPHRTFPSFDGQPDDTHTHTQHPPTWLDTTSSSTIPTTATSTITNAITNAMHGGTTNTTHHSGATTSNAVPASEHVLPSRHRGEAMPLSSEGLLRVERQARRQLGQLWDLAALQYSVRGARMLQLSFGLLVRYVMSNEESVAFLGLLQLQAAVDKVGPLLDPPGWQAVVRTLSVASCTDHLLSALEPGTPISASEARAVEDVIRCRCALVICCQRLMAEVVSDWQHTMPPEHQLALLGVLKDTVDRAMVFNTNPQRRAAVAVFLNPHGGMGGAGRAHGAGGTPPPGVGVGRERSVSSRGGLTGTHDFSAHDAEEMSHSLEAVFGSAQRPPRHPLPPPHTSPSPSHSTPPWPSSPAPFRAHSPRPDTPSSVGSGGGRDGSAKRLEVALVPEEVLLPAMLRQEIEGGLLLIEALLHLLKRHHAQQQQHTPPHPPEGTTTHTSTPTLTTTNNITAGSGNMRGSMGMPISKAVCTGAQGLLLDVCRNVVGTATADVLASEQGGNAWVGCWWETALRSPLTVHALRGYLSLELDALPSHLAPVFRDLATLARCSDITVRKEVQALMETRIGPMIAAVGGEAGGKVS